MVAEMYIRERYWEIDCGRGRGATRVRQSLFEPPCTTFRALCCAKLVKKLVFLEGFARKHRLGQCLQRVGPPGARPEGRQEPKNIVSIAMYDVSLLLLIQNLVFYRVFRTSDGQNLVFFEGSARKRRLGQCLRGVGRPSARPHEVFDGPGRRGATKS